MEEELYVLTQKTPSKNVALSYALGGILLTLVSGLIAGGAAWMVGIAGVVVLIAGIVKYFAKPSQKITLTEKMLLLQSPGKEQRMILSAIEKAEIVQRKGGKIEKIPLQQADSLAVGAEAFLVVTDAKGQRMELASSQFSTSDFEGFLYVLKNHLQTSGNLPDIAAYDKLIAENLSLLQKDEQLKKTMQKNLIDAFKALYVPRGELYLKEHPKAKVIFKYQPNLNEGATYFLEHDYQPGLDAQAVEQGKQLLLQAHQNIAVLEKRMEAYRHIAQKLTAMKERLTAQRRLTRLAGEMEILQAQNAHHQEAQSEHDLQVTTFEQLQQLTSQLSSIQDLGNAAILEQVDKILNTSS